mmetsp:Transcript_10710/g.23229  ORF Transcript_10710/g.23229 Transcript_10710/m.23229 type:complete len:1012 (-) Transcript_10710:165-3200(-)
MEESEIEGETTLIVADDGAGAGLQLPPRALSNNEEAVSLRQAGDRPSLRRSEDSEDVAPSPAASPFRSLAKRVSLLSPVRRVSQLASASPRLSRTASAVTPKASEALARFRRAVRNVQGSHTTAKRLRALAFARQVRSTVQEDDQLGPPPEREEPSSTRDVIADFMSSKPMEILFMFVTLFCLYADDMRTCLFLKESDPLFYVLTTMSLIVFSVELTIQSIVQEGYKWSFFFWMDLIAALSLIPDIAWFYDPIMAFFQEDGDEAGGLGRVGNATKTGSRAGRIVRLVRLVRLLRVVNLTKMCSREKESQLDKKEDEGENAKGHVAASRLGKILSEQTTRRIVLGVLVLMFAHPILQVETTDAGPLYGLEYLFWVGRSGCSSFSEFKASAASRFSSLTCNSSAERWLTEEAWNYTVFQYAELGRVDAALPGSVKPLLYLSIPDMLGGTPGRITEIQEIMTQRCGVQGRGALADQATWPFDMPKNGVPTLNCPEDYCCWKPHAVCSGSSAGDDPECPWRESEFLDISMTPAVCTDQGPCDHLTVSARFLIREQTEVEAMMSMLTTTLIVFMLGAGAMLISRDTQNLVIAPVEKMVNIVKKLADESMWRFEDVGGETVSNSEEEAAKDDSGLATTTLESTIMKIGSLLQVGFGEAGAQIIGQCMSAEEGGLDLMVKGKKVIAVMAICDIKQFDEITLCLQEEVMVFCNKVAKIVHTCTHMWKGTAHRNFGDSFLLTWVPPDNIEAVKAVALGPSSSDQMRRCCDYALFTFVKCLAEVRRAKDLGVYASNPKIMRDFKRSDYRVEICVGLHLGWTIEGAIGSDLKVDASFVSPHLRTSARLMRATGTYGVPLLLSGAFLDLLCPKARERCRKIDTVRFVAQDGTTEPDTIFAFDFNDSSHAAPPEHVVGEVVAPVEMPKEAILDKGVEMMFVMDQDVVHAQEGITQEFHVAWRAAFQDYSLGRWERARTTLADVDHIRPGGDGPARALLAFLDGQGPKPPPGWSGCRDLVDMKYP